MMETKAADAMADVDVQAKRDAAVRWCAHASDYAKTQGGKPWRYVLMPHDVVSDNMTLAGLVQHFAVDAEPASRAKP